MSFQDEAIGLVNEDEFDTGEPLELIPLSDLTLPSIVDNTKLSDFAGCPKKFYWAHMQGLQPGRESIHLHAGKAFATAFEKYRIAYYTDGKPFDEALGVGIIALTKAYGEPTQQDEDPDWINSAKSWEGMCCAFIHACHNWHPNHDQLRPVETSSGTGVEMSFVLELPVDNPCTDEPYLFHGRYDMLGTYGNSIFVEDDKTSTQLGTQWSKQWDLRSQFTGYCKGAKDHGVPVVGAIVRGTAILKTKITHAESIVYRPDYLIKRWEEDVNYLLEQINVCFKNNHWPTLGTFNEGCNSYGGCKYKQLCNTDRPESWLSNYHRKFWDPTNPDGEED